MTYYKYPDGDAGSIRQHALAKLYRCLDFKVFIIGMGDGTFGEKCIYDSIEYVSFRYKKSILSRIKNILFYKSNICKFIEKQSTESRYNCFHVVDAPLNALIWIKKYAKNNGINLIHDSVEWYSPEQFVLRQLSPSYLMKEFTNRLLINRKFKVIAISKYLENFFVNRGINAVRIPAILDVQNLPCSKNILPNKIKLVYAGSPGKKDYIREIILGLLKFETKDLNKIELQIIGINKEQFLKCTGLSKEVLNNLGESLILSGRLSHNKVLKSLECADFTVLLRPQHLRYAKAGFPTKIVESLSSATPVLCNLTSDLNDYIIDNVNGIVVEGCTDTAFYNSLRRVLNLTYEKRVSMQYHARETAEKYFDYRQHKRQLERFLNISEKDIGN